MKLTKLWELQKELDRNILETHNLVENEELLQKKILALNVELGELANEWRGFKFWSYKEASPKEVLLEEYVDCLHFTLSIGNQLGILVERVIDGRTFTAMQCFESLFDATNNLWKYGEEVYFRDLLYGVVGLGKTLGFKNDEIEESYLSKNKKNHKRQEDGY